MSPPGFLPVIKVSGLDLAQAASLKRTARKAAEAGRHEDAHHAWMAALANNLADVGAVRGALQTALQDPSRSRHRHTAIEHPHWLLRLSRTNAADLVLAAKVLGKFGHHYRVVELIELQFGERPAAVETEYLKALFHLGKMTKFDAVWEEIGAIHSDPESSLYRIAYLAGWGPIATRTPNLKQLEAELDDPEWGSLASRLQLIVSVQRLDPDRYWTALRKLEQREADTLAHHLSYGSLLASLGRKEEARKLARNYSRSAEIASEAIAHAQLCLELGDRDEALRLLKRYSAEFMESAGVWVVYAAVLIQTEQWDELRLAALQMRQRSAQNRLRAYSYFIEGRSDLGLRRNSTAEAAFRQMLDWEFHHPKLGLNTAAALLQFGHGWIAGELLKRLESQLGGEIEYWKLLFQVAAKLKDEPLLLAAAAKAFELESGDPVVANNYAVALLIARRNPEEALRLTLKVYAQDQGSSSIRINHALALLRNGRLADADGLLQSIDRLTLTPPESSFYHLDLLELRCLQQKFTDAGLASKSIGQERLFPSQRQWLEQAMRSFPIGPGQEIADR